MKINRPPRAGKDLLLDWRCTRCKLEPGVNSSCTNGAHAQCPKMHTRGTEAHNRHTSTQVACVCCAHYTCIAIHIQVNKETEYIHISAFTNTSTFSKKAILSAVSLLEGPFPWRMGWPRVAGRGGPRHTRVMMMVICLTMFYVDRLHKTVAAQCACCYDCLGNAMRSLST